MTRPGAQGHDAGPHVHAEPPAAPGEGYQEGLPSAESLVIVFHAALHARDFRGVEAALRLLAVQDPVQALELYDVLQLAADTEDQRT